jgi:hypothetical protein
MSVVEDSACKFCLFLVVPEGKDLGDLVNGHLIVGEDTEGQMGVSLVAEVLRKYGLEVLSLFFLDPTNHIVCHFDILIL